MFDAAYMARSLEIDCHGNVNERKRMLRICIFSSQAQFFTRTYVHIHETQTKEMASTATAATVDR